MADVFLSYSRKDQEFTQRLYDALIERARNVWADWRDIILNEDWWTRIREGILASDNFVIIVSPNTVASPVCNLELAYARELNKRIIPVLYEHVEAGRALGELAVHDLNYYVETLLEGRDLIAIGRDNWRLISSLQWIAFRPVDDFEASFQQLLAALDTDLSYVAEHTRLLVMATEWLRKLRNKSYLLHGAQLIEARTWLERSPGKEPPPTELQLLFIGNSVRQEQSPFNFVSQVRRFFGQVPRKIFISYRRSDSLDITGRIYDHLSNVLGEKEIFYDVNTIPLGTDFAAYIGETLDECCAMLVVIGKEWVSISDEAGLRRLNQPDDFVRLEVENGLSRSSIRVIPLLVNGASMPKPEELPPSLRELTQRNATPIRSGRDFKNDMQAVLKELVAARRAK